MRRPITIGPLIGIASSHGLHSRYTPKSRFLRWELVDLMSQTIGTGTERLLRQRLLLRGESTVASAGLVLAAILLTAMAASAWWTFRTQHAAIHEARRQQARAIA